MVAPSVAVGKIAWLRRQVGKMRKIHPSDVVLKAIELRISRAGRALYLDCGAASAIISALE